MREDFIPDASFVTDFRRCPEFARLKGHLGCARDFVEEAPHAGQAWHAGLRQWFSQPTSDYEAALQALRTAWGPEPLFPTKPLKRPLGQVEAILSAYAIRWPREDDPFEVVINEEYFEGVVDWETASPVTTTAAVVFHYCGIIDRKIRFEDGSEYIKDSKFTSLYLNASFFANFELSQQLRGYMAWELVSGRRCDGAFIDAAHIDTRSKVAKIKPDEDFDRRQIRYPQWKLSQWARDTERTIEDWRRIRSEIGIEERWPQHEQGCWHYNKRCPFWERCNVPEERAQTLEGYKYEDYWEPKERASATT